jgi:DNA modification methylase
MKDIPDNSIDSIVTDPPYELGFMGKSWDNTGIANNPLMWVEALRVLKPGGHLLAFSGTRTYHRMACAIEDAGFEVRDMIEWVYSSGFPKSLNIYKQLQKNCKCGNMEEYDKERTKQNTKHDLRPVSETNLSQEINPIKEQGEVLQSGLSEQSLSLQQSKSTENLRGEKSLLEGWNNNEETQGELQRSNLSEMPTGVSTNGEERRVHNATQIGDGSTLEQIIDKDGSSTSYRPQPQQQQDRKPCAFCKQWGTQKIRRTAEEVYGVGTALKPAHEPICMARKPLAEKTVAQNVLKYGTGGINIDESRVENTGKSTLRPLGKSAYQKGGGIVNGGVAGTHEVESEFGGGHDGGRFPANLIHDNSEEVRECFPDSKGGAFPKTHGSSGFVSPEEKESRVEMNDSGNASRFFKSIPIEEQDEIQEECTDMEEKLEELGISQIEEKTDIFPTTYKSVLYQAKASKSERNKGCEGLPLGEPPASARSKPAEGRENALGEPRANNHPTVKPIALMEYLIKMVTPTGGIVLDPFAGSGSTLVACKQNGFQYVGIEMTPEYIPIIEARLKATDNTLF